MRFRLVILICLMSSSFGFTGYRYCLAADNAHKESFDTITFNKYSYSIKKLKNWYLEKQWLKNYGVQAWYYLKGSNYDMRKGFIMVECYEKDCSAKNQPEKLVDSLKNVDFKDMIEIPPMESGQLYNGDLKPVTVILYRGPDCDNYQAAAYFEEKDYWVIMRMYTPSRTELNLYYPDFKELLSSYHFISDSSESYFEKISKMKNPQDPMSIEFLEEAYKNDSDSALSMTLATFSSKSNKLIPSVKDLEMKPAFERYAYEIYQLFFTPKKLLRIGRGEFGDSIYRKVKYIIVQDKMDISIIDDERLEDSTKYKNDTIRKPFWKYVGKHMKGLSKLTINEFYPDIKVEGSKIIFATNDFVSLINKYLKEDFTEFGFMSPSYASGESELRLEFLNRMVKVIPGHWGGAWYIETHPLVTRIIFNKSLTEAVLTFRLVYQGGEAAFKLVNGKWEMISSKLTWIE